jgi:hypothetical protein
MADYYPARQMAELSLHSDAHDPSPAQVPLQPGRLPAVSRHVEPIPQPVYCREAVLYEAQQLAVLALFWYLLTVAELIALSLVQMTSGTLQQLMGLMVHVDPCG